MKVTVEIAPKYNPPYAVIYADEINSEIQRAMDLLEGDSAPVTAQAGERMVILQPAEISMVRVENGQTMIYDQKKNVYYSNRRLYEIGDRIGADFLQISKSTLVNRACLSGVEAGFNGTLLLHLKNGLKDYVSRRYLPAFKQYLGL